VFDMTEIGAVMLGSTFLPSYYLPAPASPQYVLQRRKRLPILKITPSNIEARKHIALCVFDAMRMVS
jgi:hypothetical protein